MADVQIMKQVFTTTFLKPILTNLTLKTKEEVWLKSCKKWRNRRISQPYEQQLCTSSKTSSSEEFEEGWHQAKDMVQQNAKPLFPLDKRLT